MSRGILEPFYIPKILFFNCEVSFSATYLHSTTASRSYGTDIPTKTTTTLVFILEKVIGRSWKGVLGAAVEVGRTKSARHLIPRNQDPWRHDSIQIPFSTGSKGANRPQTKRFKVEGALIQPTTP